MKKATNQQLVTTNTFAKTQRGFGYLTSKNPISPRYQYSDGHFSARPSLQAVIRLATVRPEVRLLDVSLSIFLLTFPVFFKKRLIPLAIDMPMLHGMRNV